MIDVIITCYNEQDLIGDAILSVVNQTAYELINKILIVDDGSSDNSKSVIDKYKREYEKINYIYQENRGLPSARNRGIKRSSSKYIAFLDADDIWYEGKIEKQFNKIRENSKIDLIYTNQYLFCDDPSEKIIAKSKSYYGYGNLKEFFIHDAPIVPSTVLVSKTCLDNVGLFDPDLKMAQDTELWYRILAEGYVYHLKDPLIYRRQRSQSLACNTEKKREYMNLVIKKICNKYPLLTKYVGKKYARLDFSLGRYYLYNGKIKKARETLRKSLREDISHLNSWVFYFFTLMPIVNNTILINKLRDMNKNVMVKFTK